MKIDELLNNCENNADWLEIMRFGIAGQIAAKNYGWIMLQISTEASRELERGAKSSYNFLVPHLMEQVGIKFELIKPSPNQN